MFRSIGKLFSALDDGLERLVLRAPLLVVGMLTVAALAWWGLPSTTPTAPGTGDAELRQLLTNRPFIDQFPVDPRRTYHIYVFTKEGTGAYITAQNFKQVIELFFYGIENGRISYRFPNARLEGETAFSIDDCRGPGTFDIKLSLKADPKNERRPGAYYSWKRYKPRGGLDMPDGSVLDLGVLLAGKD